LGRPHDYPETLKIGRIEIIAIAVHAEINPEAFVDPEFLLAQDYLKTYALLVLGIA
jgi:hypothetical protein